jgi:hypothetical protein
VHATLTWRRRNGTWIKVTLTRSHTSLKPAWREQGTSSWFDNDVEKVLVRRWAGEAGKFRLGVQVKPPMTEKEKSQWHSLDHLAKSRQFI